MTGPSPPARGGLASRAKLLGLLAFCAIAAVAIPSLLGSKRAAIEAATLGDVRAVIAAQAAYRGRNGGRYEPRIECLEKPAACLPGYPKTGPPFLEHAVASLETRFGYRRAFHPGPAGGTGITGFAYTAVCDVPERKSWRAFCGDSTGVVCFTRDGREPAVTPDGRCDLSTCAELK
jgi:type II secretory pathway pseudopilin PulG